VKESLLTPLRYVVAVLIVLIVLAGGSFMARWGAAYHPQNLPTTAWLLASIPAVLRETLPVTAVSGVFLLFLSLVRKPGSQVLAFVLSLATATAVLFFGTIGIDRLDRSFRSVESDRQYLIPQHIHRLSTRVVFIGTRRGDSLGQLVVSANLPQQSSGPFLEYLSRSTVDPHGPTIVSADPRRRIPVEPENPFFQPMFKAPPFLSAFFADVAALNAHLAGLVQDSRLELAITAAAMALFSMSCLGFAGLSRWPLVNAMLCLVLFRGLFFVYRIITSDLTRELTLLVIHEEQLSLLPAVLLAVVGLLLLPLAFREVSAADE
jgi:hypothetical protein